MSFGLLEGHTFDEAQRRWPQMINDWLADYNQPPEGGERLDDFSQRVREFYLEVKQNYAGKNLLVVAHGGPLREILYHVLRLSNRSDWWFNFDHASLTDLLIHDERIVVNCLNDTGHLNFW